MNENMNAQMVLSDLLSLMCVKKKLYFPRDSPLLVALTKTTTSLREKQPRRDEKAEIPYSTSISLY